MVALVIFMLVCLALSAAVALYVAFPARGRAMPQGVTSVRPVRRHEVVRQRDPEPAPEREPASRARG